MSFSSSAKYFAPPFLHDWIGHRYIQDQLDLNVAFPDFFTAVLKCAWLLAKFSDSDTEIAVEIISIFMLDSKYICLEKKLKKKKDEFLFSLV